MEVQTKGSEVERVDKMWSGGWPGLGQGEGRVWGHQDTRVVGAERQIKKKVEMVREPREPAGRRPQGSADSPSIYVLKLENVVLLDCLCQ